MNIRKSRINICLLIALLFTSVLIGCKKEDIYYETPAPGMTDRFPPELYEKMCGTYDATARVYRVAGGSIVDSVSCKVEFTMETLGDYYDAITVHGFPIRLLSYFLWKNDPDYGTSPYCSVLEKTNGTLELKMEYDMEVWTSNIFYSDKTPSYGPMAYYLLSDYDLKGTDLNEFGVKYLPGVPVCRAYKDLTDGDTNIYFSFTFNGESLLKDTTSLSERKKEIGITKFVDGIALYPSVVVANDKRENINNQEYYIFIRIYENKSENE